jgi:hypothetical protein
MKAQSRKQKESVFAELRRDKKKKNEIGNMGIDWLHAQ